MATNCKQLNLGNKTEEYIGKFFRNNGYWVYITPKKINGQPIDIIAVKENNTWLVDAKHLRKEDKSFPFSRIEANQIYAMEYARKFANIKNIGFCICSEICPEKVFYLSYDKLVELEEKGRKSAKLEELEELKCI